MLKGAIAETSQRARNSGGTCSVTMTVRAAYLGALVAFSLLPALGCSTSVGDGEDGSTIADPLADDYDECAEKDWYGDGQCDRGCIDPDPDCISAECDDSCSNWCDASWSGEALPALPDGCTSEMCDCGEPPVECPDLCAVQCFGEAAPEEIPPDCPSFTCDCAEASLDPDASGATAAAASDRCLAPSPDADLKAELDVKDSAGAFLAAASSAKGKRNIPVVFHVLRTKTGAGDIGRSRMIKQIKVLNRAYARSPFKFTLSKITRTTNGTWFTMGQDSAAERGAKGKLHRGGMGTLNLYTAKLGGGLMGWSTFPWEHAGNMDGLVIHYGSLPGGSATGYTQGDISVHESGHWVGLWHTFQGGCGSPGDTVADTAAEAEPDYECARRDTCPGKKGLDPVHNYMDYGDDACVNNFTAGQRARMGRWVKWYRTASSSKLPPGSGGCGDGQCTGDETDSSCPADCGCAAISCSGVSPFGCYCDADCAATGDCCSDAEICQ